MQKETINIPLSRNESGFYYIDLGSEAHGRTSHRLWVSGNLVIQDDEKNDVVEFPVFSRIHKTAKGNFVLRRDPNFITFNVGIECGFRGSSAIFLVTDKGDYDILHSENILITETFSVLPYEIWASERGSLGTSTYALMSVKNGTGLILTESRDGRLYGAPDTYQYKYTDGRFVEYVDDPELSQDMA